MDGLFDEIEYHRQKKSMEWELESLLIPEVDAAKDAGLLLGEMPRLWAGATPQERHPAAYNDPGCCLHRYEGPQIDRVGEIETSFPGGA
ncbi:MAG: hypothetical protein IH867_03690 [Chloroflexi bacterium]|nr:hypothetical protein [Chloroflexota bacterium]